MRPQRSSFQPEICQCIDSTIFATSGLYRFLTCVNATLSLGLPPAPLRNCILVSLMLKLFFRLTPLSLRENLASSLLDNDLMRNSGVLPIHPSTPSTMAGGPWRTEAINFSSSGLAALIVDCDCAGSCLRLLLVTMIYSPSATVTKTPATNEPK